MEHFTGSIAVDGVCTILENEGDGHFLKGFQVTYFGGNTLTTHRILEITGYNIMAL